MKSPNVFAVGAFTVALTVPAFALADHSSEPSYEDHTQPSSAVTASIAPAHTAVAVPATCSFAKDVGFGSRGEDVACLQDLLIKAGILNTIDAPTGYFGSLTKDAVAAYQKKHGLPETGFFGVLSRAVAAPAPAAEHGHDTVDVGAWKEQPEVAVVLHPDELSGWNLEIVAKHFAFAPEHVNEDVVEQEGHAHVYVNGTKVARVYSSWTHLPASLFVKGENEVRVTLNANDHRELEADGEHIEAIEHVHVD